MGPTRKKRSNNGIKILRSGISVYEVEVDLGKYSSLMTNAINGFPRKLVRMFPGLRRHECYAGECGGFEMELKKGTDLAHVMEHLILEMLRTAVRPPKKFSGWTRKRGKSHVIHFQAPDSSMGRCAAVSAKTVIESIIEGKKVSKRSIIKSIRDAKEVIS
jgi:cyanophycin synthetase